MKKIINFLEENNETVIENSIFPNNHFSYNRRILFPQFEI